MAEALGILSDPYVWLLVLVGTAFGIVCGALPGVSTTLALVIALPLTFVMPMTHALVLLVAIYVSSVYGGSISAVLLRIPGTGGSIVTTFDGYPMVQQGRAGLALGGSALASCVGTIVTALLLFVIGPRYVDFALKFGYQEMFMAALWGLVITIAISPGNKFKGLIGALVGCVLSCIGLQREYMSHRLTFGLPYLETGVPLLPAIVGFFGMTIILENLMGEKSLITRVRQKAPRLSGFKELASANSWLIMIICSLIGFMIGVVPGTGSIAATLIAYGIFKRFSKHRAEYGKGCFEGVLIAETTNNAVNPGAILTTVILGIPGAAEMVVLLGAFTLHGLRAGPLLLVQHPEYLHTIFLVFMIGAIVTLVMAWTTMRAWTKAIEVPKAYLWPVIALLCILGTYSLNTSSNDVLVMVGLGLLGYFGERVGFSKIPVLMGMVLGPILESSLVVGLWLLPPQAFFTRPIALGILLLTIVTGFVFLRVIKAK